MRKNILFKSLLASAVVALGVSCTPPSADEHPNHREIPEEPDVDPELVTDELGTIAIQLADYEQLGIKIKSIDISGNNGEEIQGAAADGATGVSVSLGAAGNITAIYSTPVDISWTTTETPWNGPISAAEQAKLPAFAIQVSANTYEKGLTFKITDDQDRTFKYVYDSMVVVEAEESDTLFSRPLSIYYGTANSVRVAPAAGNVDIDITPHFSLAENLIAEGGEVLGADGNALVEAKGASIVWQQGEIGVDGDVIGTPTLSGNTLKVPTTGKKGNAVVAIKNEGGTILWSYNIWVSEANDIACTNSTYGDFTIMDRNLGATKAVAKDPDSYGNFYQWGRKDALKRQQDLTRQDERGGEITYSAFTHEMTSATIGNVAYTIQHPDVRIMSTNKDWSFDRRLNALWGIPTATTSPVKSSVKTVFDPCPAGYMVPEREAFSGFTLPDPNSFETDYGFYYPTGVGDGTVFFPAGGIIKVGAEVIQYFEYEGFNWYKNPGSGGVYILRFGLNPTLKSNVSGTMDRAYACAVRCIKVD